MRNAIAPTLHTTHIPHAYMAHIAHVARPLRITSYPHQPPPDHKTPTSRQAAHSSHDVAQTARIAYLFLTHSVHTFHTQRRTRAFLSDFYTYRPPPDHIPPPVFFVDTQCANNLMFTSSIHKPKNIMSLPFLNRYQSTTQSGKNGRN